MCRKPTCGLTHLGAMFAGLLLSGFAAAAEPSIVVRSYQAPQADGYLAISIRSDAVPAQPVAHDHVVLVDTSASQMGEHRTQGLNALRDLLSSLPANDRVSVYAVDLRAHELTQGLVAPGAALSSAMPQLEVRFPAGSTDLPGALAAAMNAVDGSRPASIVYIGDGMSTANLLQTDSLQTLVNELRDREIPVHSFAVGANRDLQLLGTLAHHTGGVVVLDDAAEDASAGAKLANAIDLPVLYTTDLQVTSQNIDLLPTTALPLRSDRETVYLGRGSIGADDRLSLTVAANGSSRTLNWNVPAAKYQQGNAFLATLWNAAEQTGGLANPLAGDSLTIASQQAFQDSIAALESEVDAAEATGRDADAAEIVRIIESVDPTNARVATYQVAQVDDAAAAPEAPPAVQTPADLEAREGESPAGLIETAEEQQRIRTQRLQTEVEGAVTDANAVLMSDPIVARNHLEDTLNAVKGATDVDPEAKAQLIRLLNSELAEVNSQLEVIQSRQQQQRRQIAVEEAQSRLLDAQMQYDLRTKELVDRVRALMLQAYEGNPNAFEEAEAVARMIASQRPGSAIGIATVFTTEAAGQLDKINRLRLLRSDRFLETLYQVELSAVPFPDEPPIRYPPAEVWQALTAKRKKWKSVDLHQNSPNEQRIYEALDSTTTLEFPGNPLRDVIEYLSQIHNIPILVDEQALSDQGISADEEISLVISGIKLRSAMKIMLENVAGVPLAYVIEDEVMKITTAEIAEEKLQTRVYPVADLVIPIMVPGGGLGAGGFGGGGGVFGGGGMGGGMGGMGGGMGGMGGGMGGMGGGMGGGFFSVPDPKPTVQQQPAVPVFDAAAVDRLKKKPDNHR